MAKWHKTQVHEMVSKPPIVMTCNDCNDVQKSAQQNVHKASAWAVTTICTPEPSVNIVRSNRTSVVAQSPPSVYPLPSPTLPCTLRVFLATG